MEPAKAIEYLLATASTAISAANRIAMDYTERSDTEWSKELSERLTKLRMANDDAWYAARQVLYERSDNK